MKTLKKIFICLTFFLGLTNISSYGQETSVWLSSNPQKVKSSGEISVFVNFDIPKGWHIYGRDAGEFGEPTKIILSLPKNFRLTEEIWKAEKQFDFMGLKSMGYADKTRVEFKIQTPEKFSAEELKAGEILIGAKITLVQCAKSCVPVEKNSTLKIALENPNEGQNISNKKSENESDKTPIIFLAMAFLGGMILNLMPCVFPVIGLKIMSFAAGAKDGYAKVMAGAAFYTLGIVLSFAAMGAVLLALKAAGQEAGWGFQLQNPIFTSLGALLFFAMGLNFAGVFEFGNSIAGASANLATAAEENAEKENINNGFFKSKNTRKYFASFLSGVLAVLVASPCTAPFMGSAVGYVLTGDVSNALTFSVFIALGLGMAAPYILISAIPQLARAMPRPGAWMEVLKNILSVPLFASAIWLVWVYSKQTQGASALLSAMLILAVGLRIFAMGNMPHYSRTTRFATSAVALLFIAAAIYVPIKFDSLTEEKIETQLPNNVSKFAKKDFAQSFVWSPEKLEQLRKEGRIVYVDFTAAWCITCQYNEKILASDSVKKAFEKNKIVVLVGDWTNKNKLIGDELAKFGRAGVPLNLLYSPKLDAQPQVLPAILTAPAVLEAIDKINQ